MALWFHFLDQPHKLCGGLPTQQQEQVPKMCLLKLPLVRLSRQQGDCSKTKVALQGVKICKKKKKKRLHTTNPLEVYKFGEKVNMASVALSLLSKIVEGEFFEKDIKFVLNLLAETKLFPGAQKDIKLFMFNRKLKLALGLSSSLYLHFYNGLPKFLYKLPICHHLTILSGFLPLAWRSISRSPDMKLKRKLYLL